MRLINMFMPLALMACATQTAPQVDIAPAEIVTAEVARDNEDPTLRLISWQTAPAGAPVDVAVRIGRIDAEDIELGDDVTDTALVYPAKEYRRTYFTLAPEGGEEVMTALRVLPLEGGRNFRELGGYEAADGRTVKWGRLYRSGVLNKLTAEDYAFIADLGIGTVVDFRSNEEREAEPTDWQAGTPDILTWDYGNADGSSEMFKLFSKPDLTPEDVTAVMTGFYRSVAYDHADKYSVLFDRMLTEDGAIAYHCSAGKDRTGVATMLVLTALGVDRETIIEDYAMSEKVVDYLAEWETQAEEAKDSPYAFLTQLPKDVVMPLTRSNPAYIEAAIAQIEADHGSVLAYIQTGLGIDDDELKALRDKYLQ